MAYDRSMPGWLARSALKRSQEHPEEVRSIRPVPGLPAVAIYVSKSVTVYPRAILPHDGDHILAYLTL